MDILILVLSVITLAYVAAPVLLWTIALGTILIFISLLGDSGVITLGIFWILFVIAAIFANIHPLRRLLFTIPFIKILQSRMPTISQTEREALEAGNVWWEKDLFCGRPKWNTFLNMPKPLLTVEEQAFLDNEVETFCKKLDDWKIVNEDHDLSEEAWSFLKSERFFGLVIPKEYGGRGYSALAHSTVVAKIATRSISAGVTTMVPNSLGPGELVLHYGTQEQKDYYLPRLARGEEIPCFALTGPEAGSDAGAMTDYGVVCYGEYNGKKFLGIRLNWDKRYITLAPVATVLGLAFKMYDPSHLLGKKEDLGVTLCLVPTSHPGVEIGNRHFPLYMSFMNGPTRGKDVFIPLDWIIGGIEKAGQGWKMLMECLSIGRSISLPALSTACGIMTYRMTGAYSRLRKQFNSPLSAFEGVEEALAEIAGMAYQLESCRRLTCSAIDQGVRPSIASAIAKYHMTEMARKVVANAMDIHSGQMIQVGPRNFIAHAHIAIPISITVEGANILTRNLIIFGQGAIRCHPYLLSEVQLLSTPDSTDKIKKLDKLLLSHIGYALSNFVRGLVTGLTGGRFICIPVKSKMTKYFRQITRMSIALSLLSDICLLVLGGNLKRKERISARLGDMLSQLYLASSVLKYYFDHDKPETDDDYVKWCIESSLYKTQVACNELLENFPLPRVGKILKGIIFTFGSAYKKPSDHLSHKIVSQMIKQTPFRDRITKNCFIDDDPDNAMQRIEIAFAKINEIEPIWKKYQKALRSGNFIHKYTFIARTQEMLDTAILTQDEVGALREYYDLYNEVIKVDEFTFDLKTVLNS